MGAPLSIEMNLETQVLDDCPPELVGQYVAVFPERPPPTTERLIQLAFHAFARNLVVNGVGITSRRSRQPSNQEVPSLSRRCRTRLQTRTSICKRPANTTQPARASDWLEPRIPELAPQERVRAEQGCSAETGLVFPERRGTWDYRPISVQCTVKFVGGMGMGFCGVPPPLPPLAGR